MANITISDGLVKSDGCATRTTLIFTSHVATRIMHADGLRDEVTMSFGFKKEKSGEPPGAPPQPRAEVQEAARKGLPAPATLSVVSRNARFAGALTGDEDVLVDGFLEGEINVTKAVTVGASGEVKASVSGETVTVMGKVLGNITASQKVILKPTAKVVGNISCATFIVNEGASFEGNINMKNQPRATPPVAERQPEAKAPEPAAPAPSKDKVDRPSHK